MAIYEADNGLKSYSVISNVDELYELLLSNWPEEGKKIEVAISPADSTYPRGSYEAEVSWELSPDDDIVWDDDQLVIEILWDRTQVEGYPDNYALDFSGGSEEDLEREALEAVVYYTAEEIFDEILSTFEDDKPEDFFSWGF